MFALATLNALNQALNNLSEVHNTLPLAAFNHLVHEQLTNEPSQYIYERLGDRYNHFYLDEFQDTSLLQWGNLRPLIADSTAAGGTALVVGDAKQSIYRWRNGEAEQFIGLSEQAEQHTFQFAGDAKLVRLADNWRSLETIVQFNNELFTSIAPSMANDSYRHLYANAGQHPQKGKGGFVELQRLPKDDFAQLTLEQTLKTIDQLLADGYTYKHIAILVRSKKHGAELVQLLTTKGLPVISGDSLLLGNSYEAKLLAGATALRTMPTNKQMRWQLADALLRGDFANPTEGAFRFSQKVIDLPQSETIELLESHFSGIAEVFKQGGNLYTFTRGLMRAFNLAGKNNAFAESYLQAIQDFVEKDQGTAFEFVRWWHDTGSGKAISSPDTLNAIQVVTIHKSKGLQYPVVLIPFANWKHHNGTREGWIPLDPDQFEGLEEMIIPISGGDAELIGGNYQKTYEKLHAQD